MSDAAKRGLERLAEQGDGAARVRLLRERIRDGSLLPSRLELAAYCGDRAAFEALEAPVRAALVAHEWQVFEYPSDEGPAEVWARFASAGIEAEKRAAAAAVGRAFEGFETTPAFSPARGALAACFGRGDPPTAASVSAALEAVRRAVRNATIVPALLETLMAAELLEQGLRGERGFESAFHAASRAVGMHPCYHAACVKVLSWAAANDPALAALLGSREARRDRRPRITVARWVRGLARWGAIPLVRAGVAATRLASSSHDRDARVLAAAEGWLPRPRWIDGSSVPGWSDSQLGRLVNESTCACGLPIPIAQWRAGTLLEAVVRGGDTEALAAALRAEVEGFALAETGALFRFHDLEVMEELGTTRLGWAFRARDAASGAERHLLALDRWLPTDAVRRALQPLRALDHPNLARLVALHGGEDRGDRGAALVFERAGGVPLDAWALALSSEKKLALVVQIARGLELAHAKGVIHSALEPRSVRVQAGEVRVADLGVAALELLRSELDPERDPEPRIHGFIAPELLKHGPDAASEATDVYGLGAIAAWLFSGRPPFEGEGVIEVAVQIVEKPAPPVPFHGAAIARALAKDPAHRFPSVAAFRMALEQP